MNKALRFSIFLAFFMSSASVFGNTLLHSVKFKLFGSKIFFTAYILDSNQIEVLFDPGTYAYMHSGTAQKHRIDYTETGKIATSSETKETNMFKNFGVSFSGFTDTFETIRSQVTAPYLNKRVDMVFGKEWIDRYIVHVDYDNLVINLYDLKGYKAPEEYHLLETVNWNRYPLVKSWFVFEAGDSAEIKVEINLGSEVGFQIDKHATRTYKLEKILQSRGTMTIYGSDGRGLQGLLTKVHSVQIGKMRQTQVRGGIFKDGYSDSDGEFVQGLVGMEFLKWYNIVFDKWNNKIYYYPKKKQ